MRPKGEGDGCPESNPTFGFVHSLEKFRSQANFFRIGEIDAPIGAPAGRGTGMCRVKLASLRQTPLFPEFSCTLSPGSEGLFKDWVISVSLYDTCRE
jgi:hypothetical protein